MTTLKTRQQKRAEKRRARKARNLFETGLEALEVPTAVLGIHFTTTESLLYQVMLLNSDRNTGRLTRTKIKQYMEWTGVKSKSSIYAALAGLNEKGVIETETDGWVTGKVLMRYKNKDTTQMELPLGLPLGARFGASAGIEVDDCVSTACIGTTALLEAGERSGSTDREGASSEDCRIGEILQVYEGEHL